MSHNDPALYKPQTMYLISTQTYTLQSTMIPSTGSLSPGGVLGADSLPRLLTAGFRALRRPEPRGTGLGSTVILGSLGGFENCQIAPNEEGLFMALVSVVLEDGIATNSRNGNEDLRRSNYEGSGSWMYMMYTIAALSNIRAGNTCSFRYLQRTYFQELP